MPGRSAPPTPLVRRARSAGLALVLGWAVAVAAGPSAAQDGKAPWPMVGRDPAHGGTISDGPAPPYREAWRAQVPGGPRGGPVVAGGAVIAVGGTGVVALDAGTGQTRWEVARSVGPAGPPAVAGDLMVHASGRGRRASIVARGVEDGREAWRFFSAAAPSGGPAVDGGRVVVGLRTGFVVALDADSGREAWRYRTQGRVETSPAVAGGLVIAASQDLEEGTATMHAIDADTGEREWTFSPPGFSLPPWSVGASGDTAVVGMGDGLIHAVALGSGEERWTHRVFAVSPAGRLMGPGVVPAIPGDVVITDGLHVYRLDPETGEERWSFRVSGGLSMTSPAVSGRAVVVGDDTGAASAIDLDSGFRVWRGSVGDAPIGPVAADGDRVYMAVLGPGGVLVALEHDPDGGLVREGSATLLDPVRAVGNFAAAAAVVGLAIVGLFRYAVPWLGRLRGPAPEDHP